MVSVVRVELTYAEAHQHLKLTCIPFQHTDICKIAPPAILSTLFIDHRYKTGRVVPRICASDRDGGLQGKTKLKTLQLGVTVTPRHYTWLGRKISAICANIPPGVFVMLASESPFDSVWSLISAILVSRNDKSP